MKSIANQYRDLKEGKMSQSNFMRNLRMSMPQYITNVTSFNDAVRILKNKAILTESEQSGPSINQMSRDEMIDFLGLTAATVKDMTDDELRDAVMDKNADLSEADGQFSRDPREMAQAIADEFGDELLTMSGKQKQDMALSRAYEKILNSGHPKAKIIARNLVFGYADEDWPMEYISTLYSILDKREDDDMAATIAKMSGEEEEEKAIKGGFGIYDPLEEDKTDDELNQAFLTFLKNIYAKSPTEKIAQMIADQEAKMGISKEDTPEIPMFKGTRDALDDLSIKEGKGKELHPNQIHPGELRMGIRVEMEHTDDPEKAKKIALDHLAENPFYYTALKLSGVESPSAPKVKAPKDAPKKAKKKDATDLVDKANQMQKVKMPKVVKEVRINAMPGQETNDTVKHAMQYIDSDIANPTLKALSNELELQPLRDNRAILRYGYWEKMPDEALAAVKKQFDVEEDIDTEDDKADSYIYIISSKKKPGNLGSSLEIGANKAGKMDAFKEALEKLVREAITEYYDGRDNLDAENE